MALSTTYTIDQIIATPQGTTPWYTQFNDSMKHIKNTMDEVTALSGGGVPGFGAPLDTRYYVADTSASTTTYTGVTSPAATALDSIPTGYSIIFEPASANTGACTLNIGSADGAVSIKKVSAGAKVALAANDLFGEVPLIYDGTDWLAIGIAPEVDTAYMVPAGGIIMWSGAISAIPSGWFLCDGTNGTPDLTGRFVIHADADAAGTYNVGDTGGSTTSGAHTLTESEIPAHVHSVDPPNTSTTNNTHSHTSSANSVANDTVTVGSGGANGSDNGTATAGNTHSHNVNIAAFDSASTGGSGSHSHANTIPPYYALAYIMKS